MMNSVPSSIRQEVLKELANIGAGHAATALAEIMNLKVGLTEPKLDLLQVTANDKVNVPNGNRLVDVLQMSVFGDAPAEMLIVLDHEESTNFVKRFLTRQVGEIDISEELITSSLREIGNIVGGAYLSALVEMIGVDLLPSTPTLTQGVYDTVLSSMVGRLDVDPESEIFLINTGFLNEQGAIHIEFFLIPHDGALDVYLHAFGVGA